MSLSLSLGAGVDISDGVLVRHPHFLHGEHLGGFDAAVDGGLAR